MTEGIYFLKGRPDESEIAAVAVALHAIGEEIKQRRASESETWSPAPATLRTCPSPGLDAWWASQFRLP
ncbi:MAG: hypothetical protein FJW50_01805 [Actinobacteria bacterium]|nr:hypothetical protein [Actinomycetota bacterium]